MLDKPTHSLQAMNISEAAVKANLPANTNNFIALGDPAALTKGQSDAPLLAARASAFGRAKALQSRQELGSAMLRGSRSKFKL